MAAMLTIQTTSDLLAALYLATVREDSYAEAARAELATMATDN